MCTKIHLKINQVGSIQEQMGVLERILQNKCERGGIG
jgi:hypothetical protein